VKALEVEVTRLRADNQQREEEVGFLRQMLISHGISPPLRPEASAPAAGNELSLGFGRPGQTVEVRRDGTLDKALRISLPGAGDAASHAFGSTGFNASIHSLNGVGNSMHYQPGSPQKALESAISSDNPTQDQVDVLFGIAWVLA